MKKLCFGIAALSCIAFIGCESGKSPPGGPGAKPVVTSSKGVGPHTTNVPESGATKQATFKIEKPGSVTLKQGQEHDAPITIDRGKDVKEDIKVTVTTDAKGLKVDPPSYTIKASDPETKYTVKVIAAADAAIGTHQINISASAGTGPATDTSFNVEVKGK
jgi:uncharacterized membrane protein